MRQKKARAAAADVGEIPEVVDPERRESCAEDLLLFCETYRPEAFSLEWSDDHRRIIKRIESTVIDGGLFALAMPRGSGKTTLAITAAIWALVYGYRRWVCLVGATAPKARQLLKSIRTELRFNPGLLADFPEVSIPVAKLEGKAARANGQTHNGKPTNILWTTEQIRLPAIEGSAASGGTVTVAGITGDIRGQVETLDSGEVIRPDYVLLDDPQTRESAKSGTQTDDRIATLNGDILGLAGPGVKIAGVMPCTVICRGDMADQMLDRETASEWHGERTQMLYGFPTGKTLDLWNRYQEIRETSFRNNGDGAEATEYYTANREPMDLDLVAAWPENFKSDEVSAIQSAMNLFFRDEGAFFSEYQNAPIEQQGDEALITEEAMKTRISHVGRYIASSDADLVTAFIDVQQELLYYVVCAWRRDFAGTVIDYGAWPDQGTNDFQSNRAKRTISGEYPGLAFEEKLRRALGELVEGLCSRTWNREDGAELSISRLLIDANWGKSTDPIYQFVRGSKFRTVLFPSHGKYVGASTEPLNARYIKAAKGKRIGTHWRIDKSNASPVRYVLFDSNYWKSFLHSRLSSELGSPGSLSLWQDAPRNHANFAKHIRAEYPVRTAGRGRQVDEWKIRPKRPDNHWLDCAAGCCVAASIEGAALPGQKPAKQSRSNPDRKRRPAVSQL